MSAENHLRSSPARLAVAYSLLVTVLVSALLGTVYLLTRGVLERDIRTILTAEVEDLSDDFAAGGAPQLIRTLKSRTDSWGRIGAVYLLADASLQPLAGNLTAWPSDVHPIDGGSARFRINTIERGVNGNHPVEARSERLSKEYWLLVGTDTSQLERTTKQFGFATLWGVGLTTLIVALLGWWYSRQMTQRVRRLAATCDSIVHGDLSGRLAVGPSNDELDVLSGTVNRMLDRLEQQAMTLRTAFGSIAHDLRTPLYRLRMRFEQALLSKTQDLRAPELIAAALTDLDRVQHTLGTLLEISRAESGDQSHEQAPVDLASLAREMVELYLPGMQDRGLALSVAATSPAVIDGQRQLLAQLIANLLENALKYVPSGGSVRVAVRSDAVNTVLEVVDDGPGIPLADRDRALQPFVRLHGEEGPGAPGSGLGLSLVAAIARLHGAQLSLQENQPGLKVVCRFRTRMAG
jgi:signal transduction histidine kinase